MKDAVATMGTILPDDVGGRDAVHVAVIAVMAGQKLSPGQDVGLLKPVHEGLLTAGQSDEPIGIVDPFLKGLVYPEQRLWLYLYPRTITSLRHNWTHPAFAEALPAAVQTAKQESEKWLRAFVERADCPDYDTLIAAAAGKWPKDGDEEEYYFSNDGEYLHFGGRDAHGEIPPEFWHHIEIVTGQKIAKHAKYFSCSC